MLTFRYSRLKGSNFRGFSGQFAKISSHKISQGQSSEIARFVKNTFLDRDIGPNEDDLVQNV